MCGLFVENENLAKSLLSSWFIHYLSVPIEICCGYCETVVLFLQKDLWEQRVCKLGFCLGLGFSVFSFVFSICLPDLQTLKDKIYFAASVFLPLIIPDFFFLLAKYNC